MKHITFKWLKRLWALLAVKLLLLAIVITGIRILIVSVNDYKESIVEWIANEHNINVSISNISAGLDFSGIVITLKEVQFAEDETLPFDLNLEHLFLHLDFINSYREQRPIFNDISLKGAQLTVKPFFQMQQSQEGESHVTLEALKEIFLSQLHSFSIKQSTVKFTDHLAHKKTIFIEDLSWLNDGKRHQGVGKASLPDTLGDNTLEFIIDVKGDVKKSNDQLLANIYAHAENLNATEYLKPQVNPAASVKSAFLSFKFWGEFDVTGPRSAQLEWGDSHIAWSMLGQSHDWKINAGQMQLTYQDREWLFDSYDLNILYNYVPWNDINVAGEGVYGQHGDFNLSGVNINRMLPFAMLFSSLSEAELKQLKVLELGGELTQVKLANDAQAGLTISAQLDNFNNQPIGPIPGVSQADVQFTANRLGGQAAIKLAAQQIYFDGQFSRAMPVQSGDIDISWINNKQGLLLSSDYAALKTDDLDTFTQFSLHFPSAQASNQSPFLSLYTYASLNDALKAQYYLPIKAMGQDVFDYLEPTLKKGTVEGAQILWYGDFASYPYQQQQGIFQAAVPLRDTQYDFYGDWQGLTEMDLNLLFENDYLLMDSDKAKLGDAKVTKLTGKINELADDGILTIDAILADQGQAVSEYLINSPLKDSVGEALQIIRIKSPIKGQLSLTIPFAEDEAKAKGKIELLDNEVDIELADGVVLPLKSVQGAFSFDDGALQSQGLKARLFEQPLNLAFATEPLAKEYKLNMDLSGHWDIDEVNQQHAMLKPINLSGQIDWQGRLTFTSIHDGGYQFELGLASPLQGLAIDVPAPYNKNALQKWPTHVTVQGDQERTQWQMQLDKKVKWLGELDYRKANKRFSYFYLGLGPSSEPVDYNKQVVRVTEKSLDLTKWAQFYKNWQQSYQQQAQQQQDSVDQHSAQLFDIDDIYLDIEQAFLFDQPLLALKAHYQASDDMWMADIDANQLRSHIEFRSGIPDRYDIDVKKLDFQFWDMPAFKSFLGYDEQRLSEQSDNLRKDYPEVFLACQECNYHEMNFSQLKAHTYPSKLRYNIDYLRLGGDDEFVNLAGVWDQRRTNIVIDARANDKNGIMRRLNYQSPMRFEKAELSGALNWIGAPWSFNLTSLNGALSTQIENGLITEVDDKGARMLSFFSLDGIRRSLNLEFGNVFSKGLGFDEMSMTANIDNGVLKSDDYFLDGSAGKVTGEGLIDLPNANVDYQFSYSPAVTSSLPVLAAFAINPLTGAAVLMLTKILEPVVDTIIRVDLSVKGPLSDPVVKIERRQRGKVKLQNSEVLEEMEEQASSEWGDDSDTEQAAPEAGINDGL